MKERDLTVKLSEEGSYKHFINDISRGRRVASYKRDWILELHNYRCQNCGLIGFDLIIHHIDHDPTNNLNSNLMVLCPSCHNLRKFKIKESQFCTKNEVSK